MRTFFAAACALVLAAAAGFVGFAGFVGSAHAQQIAFPAPAFRGGNTDWQVVLTTRQADLSVAYRLNLPESDDPLSGGLEHRAAGVGEYRLVGIIGVEKTALTVRIAPVGLGEVCKLDNGLMGDAYGRFTYRIELVPGEARPVSTRAAHRPWPAKWSGCGNFTLD